APANIAGDALDLGAHAIEALARMRRRAGNAGRRPVFAEPLAQSRAPFAGGHPDLGALDRGRHDVAAFLRRLPERIERGRRDGRVALFPPGSQARDLLALDLLRDRDDRLGPAG